MKLCLFLLVVTTTTVALARAQSDITAGVMVFSPRTPGACTAADFGQKCKDCSVTLACAGSTTPLGESKCEGALPFCDSDTNNCVATKPKSCDGATVTFVCPGVGYFPDPDNCQIYYICDSAKKATQYDCQTNFVYDSKNRYCKRRYYASDCVTMKCATADANKFITYRGNAQYYGYCDKDLKLRMFACEQNMQFNGGCNYVCTKEGYFEGKSKTQFYHCARSGLTWQVQVIDCPTGYEYNEKFSCDVVATTTN